MLLGNTIIMYIHEICVHEYKKDYSLVENTRSSSTIFLSGRNSSGQSFFILCRRVTSCEIMYIYTIYLFIYRMHRALIVRRYGIFVLVLDSNSI
jgi:hypothetical protein